MRNDSERLADINGRQFDHGGDDPDLRAHSTVSAIQWIGSVVYSRTTKAAVDHV
jgi:hypothetical protein